MLIQADEKDVEVILNDIAEMLDDHERDDFIGGFDEKLRGQLDRIAFDYSISDYC